MNIIQVTHTEILDTIKKQKQQQSLQKMELIQKQPHMMQKLEVCQIQHLQEQHLLSG